MSIFVHQRNNIEMVKLQSRHAAEIFIKHQVEEKGNLVPSDFLVIEGERLNVTINPPGLNIKID